MKEKKLMTESHIKNLQAQAHFIKTEKIKM